MDEDQLGIIQGRISMALDRLKHYDAEIAGVERRQKRLRRLAFGLLLIAVLAASVAGAPAFLPASQRVNEYEWSAVVAGIAASIASLIAFVLSLITNSEELRMRRSRTQSYLEGLRALETRDGADKYIGSLGMVSLGQSNEYFQFLMYNVRRSAGITTLFFTLGMVLMAIAVGLGIFKPALGTLSVVSAVGSIIANLFGAYPAFARDNWHLIDRYMGRLDEFSQVVLALSLIDCEKNEEVKSRMRFRWFHELVRVQTQPNSAPFVTRENPVRFARPLQQAGTGRPNRPEMPDSSGHPSKRPPQATSQQHPVPSTKPGPSAKRADTGDT